MAKYPRSTKILSMDFKGDLESKEARRRFFWAFLLIVIVFGILYLTVSPSSLTEDLGELFLSASVEIISAALIILLVYGIYVYFIGVNREAQDVEVIRPGDINGEIRALSKETTYYFLWARSATYFRSETLRELDTFSRKHRRTVEVTLLLPDPDIPELSKAYDDMMSAVGEERGKDKLLKNAIATSVACAIIAANNRNLRVNLFFSKFLPAFRIDISEQGALLTEDDKTLYALKFSRGSQFFEMFRSMIVNEKEISRAATWDESAFKGVEIENTTISFDLMDAFGFDSSFIRAHQDEISNLVTKRDHRYKK